MGPPHDPESHLHLESQERPRQRRSRLKAFVTIVSISFTIMLFIFAIGLIVWSDSPDRWKSSIVLGAGIGAIVTIVFLVFLKGWIRWRPHLPAIIGNRRHGYAVTRDPENAEETVQSFHDWRMLDTPTKIAFCAEKLGDWLEGLSRALYPCCRRRNRGSKAMEKVMQSEDAAYLRAQNLRARSGGLDNEGGTGGETHKVRPEPRRNTPSSTRSRGQSQAEASSSLPLPRSRVESQAQDDGSQGQKGDRRPHDDARQHTYDNLPSTVLQGERQRGRPVNSLPSLRPERLDGCSRQPKSTPKPLSTISEATTEASRVEQHGIRQQASTPHHHQNEGEGFSVPTDRQNDETGPENCHHPVPYRVSARLSTGSRSSKIVEELEYLAYANLPSFIRIGNRNRRQGGVAPPASKM